MKKLISFALGTMLLSFGSGVAFAESTSTDARVAQAVQPAYPQLAQHKQITGHVIVEYIVNENGRAENITIVEAQPKRVFEEAAIEAIENSTFSAATVDGQPVASDIKKQRFVFDIAGL